MEGLVIVDLSHGRNEMKKRDEECYSNPTLESARRFTVAMTKQEKIWKKQTPKGMVFKGVRFESFRETTEGGWVSMGFRPVPVYSPLPKKRRKP